MRRPFHIRTAIAVLLLALLAHMSAAHADTPPTPVFDAGTVIGDFARDYDAASDKYSTSDIVLQGRVGKVDIRKGPSGHTFVRIQLVPRELGSNAMIPIYVDFPETMAAEVGKLKMDDVVQISAVYSPTPAAAPIIHEIRGFIGSKVTPVKADPKLATLRQDLINWVKKNNDLKPGPNGTDNQLVADMSKKIDVSLARGDDFSICFGPGLMMSGSLTTLCVQDGKMLPVVWPPAQAAILKFPDMSAVHVTSPSTAIRMPVQVQMTTPAFNGGTADWNLKIPIKGKVNVKVVSTPAFLPGDENLQLTPGDDSPINCGMRMVCYSDTKRIIFFASFHSPNIGTATYPFQFGTIPSEIADLKVTAQPSPRIVFFEIVRRTEHEKSEPVDEILSEPAAMILNMSAK